MITFFILNLFAFTAVASLLKLLWVATQQGQIFGKWQDLLHKMDVKGSPWYKFLGGCEFCTAHFFAFVSYPVFAAFSYYTGLFPFAPIHLLTWYLIYVPITSITNYLFLTKL